MEKKKLDRKTFADILILTSLIIGYFCLLWFLMLIFILSMLVYPMCCLLYYGLTKIREGIIKEIVEKSLKGIKILYGVFCILFSLYWLIVVLFTPYIRIVEIIYLFAFPIIIIGIAGIIKGAIIKDYVLKYRVQNSIIGIITLILGIFAFALAPNNYLFHISSLSIAVIINIVLRASMYLSEYNLTLRFKNIKIFFYILNDYSDLEINRRITLRRVEARSN